jgi:hypothetical protein
MTIQLYAVSNTEEGDFAEVQRLLAPISHNLPIDRRNHKYCIYPKYQPLVDLVIEHWKDDVGFNVS